MGGAKRQLEEYHEYLIQRDMSHSQQIQEILDRANEALRTNTVLEYLQEVKKNFTSEENKNIDEAVQRILRNIPFTGIPHKLENPQNPQ